MTITSHTIPDGISHKIDVTDASYSPEGSWTFPNDTFIGQDGRVLVPYVNPGLTSTPPNLKNDGVSNSNLTLTVQRGPGIGLKILSFSLL